MKARFSRALGLDGNPLRRASDRAEAWIQAGLLALFLTAAPVVAVAAGHLASHAAVPGASAHARAVRAILLRPAAIPGGLTATAWTDVWVRARWESADGSARTGEVFAPAGGPAGTVETVWLNAAGRVASPPGSAAFASVVAPLTAMALAIAAVALAALDILPRRRAVDKDLTATLLFGSFQVGSIRPKVEAFAAATAGTSGHAPDRPSSARSSPTRSAGTGLTT